MNDMYGIELFMLRPFRAWSLDPLRTQGGAALALGWYVAPFQG
jgi:hypothetical protein